MSQFIRFCLVGVLNTAIDLTFYYILTRYLGFAGELIFIAKGISFIIATFNSFILNRFWTFKKEGGFLWKELLTFYTVIGSGIFINIGIHFLDTRFFGINDLFSSLVAAGFTALWGFTLAKYIVFK